MRLKQKFIPSCAVFSKALVLLLVGVPLLAQANNSAEELAEKLPEAMLDEKLSLIAERPSIDGAPTKISLGLYVFDLAEVNDVKQVFTADIFFIVRWTDPRLALPKDERQGKLRSIPAEQIWTPRGMIVNDRGMKPQLPRYALINDDGEITTRQRLWGELGADLDFERFPFEDQILPIDVISYAYSPQELQFSHDVEFSGDSGAFSAEGWDFEILPPVISEFRVPAFYSSRPLLSFKIKATRNGSYYLLTMFLPMTMIIFMAWSVFWLQPDIIPARIGISTASIFSFVAFGFSIRSKIPEVSYMTLADVFVTGSTLLVFSGLAITVWGSRLANSDRLDEALRINRAARIIYPLFYLLIAGVSWSV